MRFAREGANIAINYRSGAEQREANGTDVIWQSIFTGRMILYSKLLMQAFMQTLQLPSADCTGGPAATGSSCWRSMAAAVPKIYFAGVESQTFPRTRAGRSG